MSKKHLVYISHPSGGKVENTLETEEFIKLLYQNDNIFDNFCFVSPIHCYGFMYDDVEYYKGLSFCTDLLEHCELMLLLGDWEKSKGCTAEKKLCEDLNIPYIEIRSVEALKDFISHGLINEMIKKVNYIH